jgi:hypothetical protein
MKAWCAYVEGGLMKGMGASYNGATQCADAAVADFLKRYPDEPATVKKE